MADDRSLLIELRVQLVFHFQILEAQFKDARCGEIKEQIRSGDARNFSVGNERELLFMGRLYVLDNENLR